MELNAILYPKGGPTTHVVMALAPSDMAVIAVMARRALDMNRTRKHVKATLLLAEDYVSGSLSYKFDHALNARFEFNKVYFDSSAGAGSTITMSATNESSLRIGPLTDDVLDQLLALHGAKACTWCGLTAKADIEKCGLCETVAAAEML